MATTTIKKFPMDGYADTCVGYGNAADGGCETHGSDELTGDGLCADCTARLNNELRESREAMRPSYANDCRYGGCKDHQHGSAYFTCMCCYGD